MNCLCLKVCFPRQCKAGAGMRSIIMREKTRKIMREKLENAPPKKKIAADGYTCGAPPFSASEF